MIPWPCQEYFVRLKLGVNPEYFWVDPKQDKIMIKIITLNKILDCIYN